MESASTKDLDARTRKILDRAARLEDEKEEAIMQKLEGTLQMIANIETYLHHMVEDFRPMR